MLEHLGVIGIGLAIGYTGFLLLGEYRKAFLDNPRAVMTLEVMFQIAKLGGPGYLAIMCLIAAVIFVAMGLLAIITESVYRLGVL
jgi:hypothetical protein